MLTKETIKELNAIAQIDFPRAQAMLDGINLALGTKFGWVAKRVVIFDNPDGSIAEKYAGVHDAEAIIKTLESEKQSYLFTVGALSDVIERATFSADELSEIKSLILFSWREAEASLRKSEIEIFSHVDDVTDERFTAAVKLNRAMQKRTRTCAKLVKRINEIEEDITESD